MRIGIDLGGTKIEAIAIADDGREQSRRRVQTPRGDYDRTLAAIADLVKGIEHDIGHRGSVGIGIPGAVSPVTQLIKNANSTWLIGRPLADDLARLLDRPVRLANDANCFALSEATDGAAAGADVVFGVILGTGTGAGVVVHGRVIVGANAIGGEWGHNPLPAPKDDERPGPLCYCGRFGCVETFLSGPGLARDFAAHSDSDIARPFSASARDQFSRATADAPTSLRQGYGGPPKLQRRRKRDEREGGQGREAGLKGPPNTGEQIAGLAARGDPAAVAALERYEERLARALANVVNILDPDVIVLGGGLSNIDRLYESVPRLWTPHVFSDHVATRLVRAKHGDSSGVRGAAWLWDAGAPL